MFDQNDAASALPLVQSRIDQDSVLLRLARAEKILGLPQAGEHVAMLADRFAAERARGTPPHWREEAYFALYLTGDRETALERASANFALQREAVDARPAA